MLVTCVIIVTHTAHLCVAAGTLERWRVIMVSASIKLVERNVLIKCFGVGRCTEISVSETSLVASWYVFIHHHHPRPLSFTSLPNLFNSLDNRRLVGPTLELENEHSSSYHWHVRRYVLRFQGICWERGALLSLHVNDETVGGVLMWCSVCSIDISNLIGQFLRWWYVHSLFLVTLPLSIRTWEARTQHFYFYSGQNNIEIEETHREHDNDNPLSLNPRTCRRMYHQNLLQ